MRPRFNLKWLFWLVTCSAMACWLLRMPAYFVRSVVNYNVIVVDGEAMHGTLNRAYIPTHWAWEVAFRIAICGLIFLLPAIFIRATKGPIRSEPGSSPCPSDGSIA